MGEIINRDEVNAAGARRRVVRGGDEPEAGREGGRTRDPGLGPTREP